MQFREEFTGSLRPMREDQLAQTWDVQQVDLGTICWHNVSTAGHEQEVLSIG